MYFKYIFLIATFSVVHSEYVDYTNHKVYKITPSSDQDVKILVELEKSQQYFFWTEEAIRVGKDVRIQVAPEKQDKFEKYLSQVGISGYLLIEDVQKLIDDQRQRPSAVGRNSSVPIRSYSWEYYQSLEEIYTWMDATAAAFPDVATIITIGTTVNNRPIRGMVIDYKRQENKTFGIMEGALHAREWITSATLTWVIEEFLTSTDPGVRAMAEDIVWHIFPVTNPDGYAYSFDGDRMWRKNRNTAFFRSCVHLNLPDDASNGVDLNRNFDFLWNTAGASNDSCTQIFAGPSGFSEIESISIANHVGALQSQGTVLYYLGYHSFTQLLLVPFSHTGGADVLEVDNYGDLFEIGIRAMDKLTARHNTTYTVGTSADILYIVSGSGFDWAKGAAKIPIVFLFELRDLGEFGFLLPARYIIPNNEETVDGLAEMHKYVKSLGYYQASDASTYANSLILVILSISAMLTMGI